MEQALAESNVVPGTRPDEEDKSPRRWMVAKILAALGVVGGAIVGVVVGDVADVVKDWFHKERRVELTVQAPPSTHYVDEQIGLSVTIDNVGEKKLSGADLEVAGTTCARNLEIDTGQIVETTCRVEGRAIKAGRRVALVHDGEKIADESDDVRIDIDKNACPPPLSEEQGTEAIGLDELAARWNEAVSVLIERAKTDGCSALDTSWNLAVAEGDLTADLGDGSMIFITLADDLIDEIEVTLNNSSAMTTDLQKRDTVQEVLASVISANREAAIPIADDWSSSCDENDEGYSTDEKPAGGGDVTLVVKACATN